jgi:hypothetical protein
VYGALKDAYSRCDMFRQISILRDVSIIIPEDGDQAKHVKSKINEYFTKSVLLDEKSGDEIQISIVTPTRCTIFEFIEYHSTCFGRTFRPSSGHEPASKQSTNLYDIYLMLYVQSITPDDGRKDRPKHVE